MKLLSNRIALGHLNNRGLTLIEIVIVVAILASLVAILAGRVTNQQKKANVKAAKIEIAGLANALELYYTDCGFYPSSDQGLTALTADGSGSCPNWGPDPYLKKLPKDPWGSDYVYYNNDGQYEIISLGEDRREGGSGYGKDISSNE